MTYPTTAKGSKPVKPRPDFPLLPHATGRWAKKIRGKLHYFGKWANPDAALQRYVEDREDLYAGRKPRRKREGLTVKELVNKFLLAKKARVDAGELALGTFAASTRPASGWPGAPGSHVLCASSYLRDNRWRFLRSGGG
jgi:hypothetical protein